MRIFYALCFLVQYGACVTYVWDLLKPPLSAVESQAALASAQPGQSYPTYSSIPNTGFRCGQQAGYYADTETRCQVFHRCDLRGELSSYLCPNKTIFNQITLVCDFFYNVDCARSPELVNFANSRLYSNGPLFESPPASYVAPTSRSSDAQMPPLSNAIATTRKPTVTASRRATTQSPPRLTLTPMRGSMQRTTTAAPEEITTENAENSVGRQRHYSSCSLYSQFKNTPCVAKAGFSTDAFEALKQKKNSTVS